MPYAPCTISHRPMLCPRLMLQECSTGQPMADVFAIDTTGKVSSVGKLPDAFSTEACTTGMGSATGEATVVCPSSSYVYSLESQKFTQTANSTKSPTLLGGNPVTSMFATEVAMLDSSGAVWAYDPMQCSYNCSHNGLCVAGFCNCYDNFQGQFCETEVACVYMGAVRSVCGTRCGDCCVHCCVASVGKGKGKVLGRSPNSSVSVIPTCPSQHPFRLAGSQTP